VTLSIRPSKQSDFMVFLQCYEDWPIDEFGRYTVDRAIKESRAAAYLNEKVTEPLTADSDWTQTLIILNDGVPIGLNRAKATGTSIEVLNQAFIPEWRGRGLFDELQTLLQDYAFNTLQATEATYAIFKRSAAAVAHVENRTKYRGDGEETSPKTGEVLKRGRIDRSAWEEATRPVPGDPPDGSPDGAADRGP
jgi:hypothetical protein